MQGDDKHNSEIRRTYSWSLQNYLVNFVVFICIPLEWFFVLEKEQKEGEIFLKKKYIAPHFRAPLFLQYAYSRTNLCVHLCIYVDITIHMYVRNVNTREVRNPKMKIYTNKRWCDDRMENRGLKKCVMIPSWIKRKIEPLFH